MNHVGARLLVVCLTTAACMGGERDVVAEARAREIAENPAWGDFLRHDSLVIDSIARAMDTDSLYLIRRAMSRTRSTSRAAALFQAHMCERQRLSRAHGHRAVERALTPGARADWTSEDQAAYENVPVPSGLYGLNEDECGKSSGPPAPDSVSGVSLGSSPGLAYWKRWRPIPGQDSLLKRMASDSIPVRMRAVDALAGAIVDDVGSDTGKSALVAWSWRAKRDGRVALAVIRLLERENAQIRSGGDFDEEYSEHYASLIYRVAALRDVRAVDALAGALDTGAMAWEGLADLGDAAIPALERLARSKDKSERWLAARVLSSIASRSTSPRFDLSRTGAETVQRELQRLQDDSDRHVREQATQGLTHFEPQSR